MNRHLDGCLLALRFCHLAGYRTFPNQFVQTLLITRLTGGQFVHVCRTDCLVCLLRTLRFGAELTGMYVLFSVLLRDHLFAGSQSQGREVDRVGTHIGDSTALI